MKKVASHPDILHGKPYIIGTSITISSIMGRLAKGLTIKQISHQLPQLSEEDVVIAIKFAEEVTAKPIES
jgi:uncharacterized protein (DUF433 family)